MKTHARWVYTGVCQETPVHLHLCPTQPSLVTMLESGKGDSQGNCLLLLDFAQCMLVFDHK